MDAARFHTLSTGGNSVVLDAEIGHLRRLALTYEGRTIMPLHTAPWVSDAPIDRTAALPPTEQGLSGDFLCAPFCANDVEPGPLHGWTANGPWQVRRRRPGLDHGETGAPSNGRRNRQDAAVSAGRAVPLSQPFVLGRGWARSRSATMR